MKTPAAKSPATPSINEAPRSLSGWRAVWSRLGSAFLRSRCRWNSRRRLLGTVLVSFLPCSELNLVSFGASVGVIWCHLGALWGSFVHFCSSKVATEGSGEGNCVRVVSMDVLETRKHTDFQWILTFFLKSVEDTRRCSKPGFTHISNGF